MTAISLGMLPWSQGSDWRSFEDAARRIDSLGYDHLWVWDHVLPIFGATDQPIFEGWMSLAAWSKVTTRARLGLLVGANTFRAPGLTAKLATTLDHISDGRAILGLGGAWFETEHVENGIDFGSGFGERLDRLDAAVGIIREVLDGGAATRDDGPYRVRGLSQLPLPVQRRLPIMIGGSGEKKTLRIVARYADMWNAMGTPDFLARKRDVLLDHCAEVGRDPHAIEWTVGCKPTIRDSEREARRVFEAQMAHNRTPLSDVEDDDTFWYGTPDQLAEQMRARRDLGFRTFIAEMPAPYDIETVERWIGEVKPLVEAD